MDMDRGARQVVEHNKYMSVGIFSTVGDRAIQQDSYDYCLDSDGGIVVICDGMGGHQGGETASAIATQKIIEDYKVADRSVLISEFLIGSAKQADAAVSALKDQDGEPMRAGSTMVTVIIRDYHLHWLSVGDSRIYLKRGKEFIQITFDHVYRGVLNEQLQECEITEAEYQRESAKGSSLISYIGIGALNLIDYNNESFALQSGDIIIMMSDGLYKTLSDDEMNLLLENITDINDLIFAIEAKAMKKAEQRRIKRDNTTFAIIKMK